jgi:hypothetical protein
MMVKRCIIFLRWQERRDGMRGHASVARWRLWRCDGGQSGTVMAHDGNEQARAWRCDGVASGVQDGARAQSMLL